MSASSPGQESSARRLRIAVFNRTFSNTGGGAERYSIALVRELAPRHEVHVFSQETDQPVAGVHYHRVGMPLRKPRWVNQLWYATAAWWATRRGFDVIHSHENTWHGAVQTVHVLPVRYNLFHGRSGLRRVLRWIKVATSPRLLTYLGLERLRYTPCDGRQVVVTSPSLRDIQRQAYPASALMLSVVTPGITLPAEPTSAARRQQARQVLGLPLNATCLLFVGNDYRKKGLGTVLESLATLPPDVVLAVVGNPAHIAAFAPQVARLGLDGRVHFLGALNDVGPAYEAADLLVHPTLEDTFAMVVLEAMAHGLPVVVSGPAWCGISGLLGNGVNALLLERPDDAAGLACRVAALLEPSGGLNADGHALAEAGRKFASAYQWREIALQQETLYFRAVQGGSRR